MTKNNLSEKISAHISALPAEKQAEVLDFVLFLEQQASGAHQMEARRQRLITALHQLHQAHVFADIEDPVTWQRELRKDRSLPLV